MRTYSTGTFIRNCVPLDVGTVLPAQLSYIISATEFLFYFLIINDVHDTSARICGHAICFYVLKLTKTYELLCITMNYCISIYFVFLGCSCASASVHIDPDCPQQMA